MVKDDPASLLGLFFNPSNRSHVDTSRRQSFSIHCVDTRRSLWDDWSRASIFLLVGLACRTTSTAAVLNGIAHLKMRFAQTGFRNIYRRRLSGHL